MAAAFDLVAFVVKAFAAFRNSSRASGDECRRLEIRSRATSRPWASRCRAGNDLFHDNLGFPPPDPGQAVGGLNAQPVVGTGPACILEADGHFRRDFDVAIDDARESLARHAKRLRRIRWVP